MRVIWNTLEKIDRASIVVSTKLDELLTRPSFRARTEKAIEHVRPPQKAITFDA